MASSLMPEPTQRTASELERQKMSPWRQPAVLMLAILLVYAPTLFCGFVWDDDLHVTQNIITGPDGLRLSWVSGLQPNYWPVTWTIFWAEWRLSGGHPWLFHLVSIVLHASAAVLTYRALLLLRFQWPGLAAAVFAFHPVNVESVTWIAQQKTLLSAAFCLLSLVLVLHWRTRQHWALYAAALISFAVSLLAKSSSAPFPVALMALLSWHGRQPSRNSFRIAVPFFVLSAAQSILEIYFQTFHSIGEYKVHSGSLTERLVASGWTLLFYLYKAAIPLNLSFVYPRWQVDTGNPIHWIPLVSCLAMAGAAAFAWLSDRKGIAAAFVWYAMFLLPVAGFINVFYFRYSSTADHYQYLSLAAFSPVVVAVSAQYASRHLGRAGRLCAASAITLLVMLTFLRQFAYLDPIVLWRDTIRANPKAGLAYANLGQALSGTSRRDEAKELLMTAIELGPDGHEAYNNLGNILLVEGQTTESIRLFKKATDLMPSLVQPKRNLAIALHASGQPEAALAVLRMAKEQSPYNYGVLQAEIAIRLSQKDTTATVELLRTGLSLFPKDQWLRSQLDRQSELGKSASGKDR